MTLISYINNGNPVFSVTEEKDINIVISLIFRDYIDKDEINPEDFSGKIISIKDNSIASEPYDVKIVLKGGPLESFEETAKLYDTTAYFFDDYACYLVHDKQYTELDSENYKIEKCSVCGNYFLKKDMIEDFCMDCFVNKGIKEIFTSLSIKSEEEYTEFETLSKVWDTIDSFTERINSYLKVEKVAEIAKQIAMRYIQKEKVPYEYVEKIVGGLTA